MITKNQINMPKQQTVAAGQDTLLKPDEQKDSLGFNREYTEWRIEATPVFELRGDTNKCVGYDGEIISAGRTGIRIEPFRAEVLNRTWFSRGLILLEAGEETKEYSVRF